MPKEKQPGTKNTIKFPQKKATPATEAAIKQIAKLGFSTSRDGELWKADDGGDRIFKAGRIEEVLEMILSSIDKQELGEAAAAEIGPEPNPELISVDENPITGQRLAFSEIVVRSLFEAGKKHALLVKERMRLAVEEDKAKTALLEIARKKENRKYFTLRPDNKWEYVATGVTVILTDEHKVDVHTKYDEKGDPNASKSKGQAA